MRSIQIGKTAETGLSYEDIDELEKRYTYKTIPEKYLSDIKIRYPGRSRETLFFIWRAELRFNREHFDYSKVDYKTYKTAITVVCLKKDKNGDIHGEFTTKPIQLLRAKYGCDKCASEGNAKVHTLWAEEEVLEIAKKYDTLKDFRTKEPRAYDAARRQLWLYNYTWLSRELGFDYDAEEHCIYAYEFPSYNTVYVGLTLNKDRRDNAHRVKHVAHAGTEYEREDSSAVYVFCIENGIDPKTIDKPIYIYENLKPLDAKRLEGEVLEDYKSKGWIALNRAKTGSLGGGRRKWTKENVIELFSKFPRLSDLDDEAKSAYVVARRNKWLTDEIEDILWPSRDKKLKDYTKENMLSKAKELGNKFMKNWNFLMISRRLNILPEIYHIIGYPRQDNYVLVFDKEYTHIIGKYKDIKETITTLNIKRNESSLRKISKDLNKETFNGYGYLKEDLFEDFLQTVSDKNLINSLREEYNKANLDFDNRIREDCEKYKNFKFNSEK